MCEATLTCNAQISTMQHAEPIPSHCISASSAENNGIPVLCSVYKEKALQPMKNTLGKDGPPIK